MYDYLKRDTTNLKRFWILKYIADIKVNIIKYFILVWTDLGTVCWIKIFVHLTIRN